MQDHHAFAERFGFRRRDVTLANWRTAPFNRWSFQNLRELAPTTGIQRASATEDGRVRAPATGDFLAEVLPLSAGPESVNAFLQRSATNLLLVLKNGVPVVEWHAPHAEPDKPHLLFSISKSLTALVAGILAERGVLDLEGPVALLLPDVAGSAYADARLRHILDMRVSLDFEESPADTSGSFARYRRATLWNPPSAEPAETLRSFILSLAKGAGDHGGPFRYRSPNSDLLGLALEAATGERFADLIRICLLEPLGAAGEAYVAVDAEGTARPAGGILTTAHDLARVGEAMRGEGVYEGRQVLPKAFVRDTIEGGDREAWQGGDLTALLPNGAYRNNWYATGDGSLAALGINGQWLFTDPAHAVTIVKFSSQEKPQDLALDLDTLAFFRTVVRIV